MPPYGSSGQDTVWAGTFWGVLNVSLCHPSSVICYRPVKEVIVFRDRHTFFVTDRGAQLTFWCLDCLSSIPLRRFVNHSVSITLNVKCVHILQPCLHKGEAVTESGLQASLGQIQFTWSQCLWFWTTVPTIWADLQISSQFRILWNDWLFGAVQL